jgi:hypothetical protein
MSSYFKSYPKITITDPVDGGAVDVVDMFRRLKLNGDIQTNNTLYEEYYIKDGERPEQIANNYYGDIKYYWLILLVNNIHYDEWALSNSEIEQIVYDRLDKNDILFYRTIELKNSNGYIVVPYGLIVGQYFSKKIDNITISGNSARVPVTAREDIIEKNENKRKILLLNPLVVARFEDDFIKLIKYQTNILNAGGNKFEEI